MRSRISRSCGTVLKCALALGFCFSSSATVMVTALTPVPVHVQRSADAAQCGHGEDYRVKLLVIPQLCEIKAYRGGLCEAAFVNLIDEPGQTFIHCFRWWKTRSASLLFERIRRSMFAISG